MRWFHGSADRTEEGSSLYGRVQDSGSTVVVAPEIQTQDVAKALDIHPFMLSKWKKDYREGKLKPAAEAAGLSLPAPLRLPRRDPEKQALRRQVKQLEAKVEARTQVRSLERKLAALEVEHDLLKKAIRFNIERRKRSSNS